MQDIQNATRPKPWTREFSVDMAAFSKFERENTR
jgi:hypothetical protein